MHLFILTIIFTGAAVDFSLLVGELSGGNAESSVEAPESPVLAPESPVQSPESPIEDPESPVQSPESPIEDPENATEAPESLEVVGGYIDDRVRGYRILLEPEQLYNTYCCEERRCFRNKITADVIRNARRLWYDATHGNQVAENQELLRILHQSKYPGQKVFRLTISGERLCYNAWGMVHNFRRTRMYERMKDAREGMYFMYYILFFSMSTNVTLWIDE